MWTIEYCNDGDAISDFHVNQWVVDSIKAKKVASRVSTENVVYVIRALVSMGAIDPATVQFKYQGTIMGLLPDGRLNQWAAGFCELQSKCLEVMLTTNFDVAGGDKHER